jgi:hypothetical protein
MRSAAWIIVSGVVYVLFASLIGKVLKQARQRSEWPSGWEKCEA